MKSTILTAVGVLAVIAGAAHAQTSNFGPDVTVGSLDGATQTGGSGPQLWGAVNGMSGFSIGTTSCNVGTQSLDWYDNSNRHPVISQTIYRIKDGRIMQLGQSYVKHGFCALQGSLCQSCTPFGGGCNVELGVGCSDPYSPSLNGSQGGLGRKSDINASTGAFSWPYSQQGQTGNATFKRIQVRNTDIDANLNAGAVYVGEGLYVAADDAAAGNDANNASYRLIRLGGTASGGATRLIWNGSTQRQKPAIMAWAEHGLGVNTPDAGVFVDMVRVDGVFFFGSKASDLGGGLVRYEYAIQNLTSDRSGGSFTVPFPAGATVTDIFFHDVDYHSGEPYDNTDWSVTVNNDNIRFASPQTFAQNPNSNALRWGTTYNFGFTINASSELVTAPTLGMFKPGAVASVNLKMHTPAVLIPIAPCNAADLSAAFEVLDINDVLAFADAFNAMDPAVDFFADGMFDINDVLSFATEFNTGCP